MCQISNNGFRTVFNLLDVGILIQEAETGRVIEVNDRICEMRGATREEILAGKLNDLMAGEPPYSEADALEKIWRLDQEGPQLFEWLAQATDGRLFWVEVSLQKVIVDGYARVIAMVRDIDKQKQLACSLDHAESRMTAVLEALPDLLFILDQSGLMLECVPSSLDKLYVPLDQLIGKKVSDVLPEEAASVIMTALENAERHGVHHGATYALDLPQGRTWFSLSIAPLQEKGESSKRFVALAHDITDLQQAHEHIDRLAYQDPLTGLPNRNLARDRLELALTHARRAPSPLAVLCVDLNGFKLINNGYGHSIGDQLLKAVSQRLAQQLRKKDTLCRLCADEFLIILWELDPEHSRAQVSEISERLLDAFSQPFSLEFLEISASASIGISLYPEDGSDTERLMRQAHIALHQAKQLGQNNSAFFEPQMNHQLLQFNNTRDAMRTALDRDEFELYYQPQIHLKTGKVVGIEALIRWRHPDLGMMEPMGFLEAAETSGLIVPMGRWALREACRQAAVWHAAGWSDLVMAVNLSAKQFLKEGLATDITAALVESGCEPHWLELELTESILLHDIEASTVLIAHWKRLGIKIAIDDFGTGYSSLAYLKRLQVDKLKIDKTFVADLMTDDSDRAIVQAILQMARAMNLKILAEGVENAEMAQLLLEMGCDEAQGFYYAKAMSAQELEKWLASR